MTAGRRIRRIAAAGVVALALAGCGGAPAPAPEAAPGAGGFPRTVEHAMGATDVPAPPQRVAALDSSFVDATLALGVPVAAHTRFPSEGGQVPAYYGPEDRALLEGAREVGTLDAPDVEALFDVAPDVIVSARIRHEEFYGQFAQVAPTVFSETTGPTWKDNIRLTGRVLGRDALAQERIAAYEARAREIGESIRARDGRLPTVSVVRFTAGESTVRLASSGSFTGTVLADVGLPRPPGQPDDPGVAVDIPQERITELDAERLFVSSFADTEGRESDARARFEANPLWATLRGVRAEVDDTVWFTSVGLQGAHRILDDLAAAFGVDPARG